MNKSIIFITLGILVVGIVFGIISFIKYSPTTPYTRGDLPSSTIPATNTAATQTSPTSTNSSSAAQPSSTTTPVVDSSKISSSVLAQHSSQSDCWLGYGGKVYDLSSWLPKHPGSAGAIAPYCGTSTEFEQAFKRQHGTSKANLFMKVAVYKGDLG